MCLGEYEVTGCDSYTCNRPDIQRAIAAEQDRIKRYSKEFNKHCVLKTCTLL